MKTKIEILDRLVKDGAIDLSEALILLETEKEYVPYQPYIPHQVYPNPYSQPPILYSTLPINTIDITGNNYIGGDTTCVLGVTGTNTFIMN